MKKPAKYLLLEVALCLIFALLPVLFALWPQDIMAVLSILFSHAVYPAMALILPLIAARRGATAFLCAVPPFLLYLLVFSLLGLSLPAIPALLTLFLSVTGANIGAELRKRAK